MTNFQTADLKSLSEAILSLHTLQIAEEFPKSVFQAMGSILSGEVSAIDWLDMSTYRSWDCIYSEKSITPEQNAVVHAYLAESLTYDSIAVPSKSATVFISDFTNHPQWSRQSLDRAMQEIEVSDYLFVFLPMTKSLSIVFVNFYRNSGKITESERMQLKLIAPHVQHVYQRLISRGQVTEPSQKTPGLAIAKTDANFEKCEFSEEAREILNRFDTKVTGDALPEVIHKWLKSQKKILSRPSKSKVNVNCLRLKQETKQLTIYVRPAPEDKSYMLIFEEKETSSVGKSRFPSLGLTPREDEVLFWVTQGKSNGEIAAILGVSAGTVGRHLENIFPKLGVENRHAARLIATEALESDSTP